MTDPPTDAPAAAHANPESRWTRSWTEAPAGLADLDAAGVIVAANDAFCAMAGLTAADLAGTVRWVDVLSVGSRLFYETQIVALLHVEGAATEVMVDVSSSAGASLPSLLTARIVRDESGRVQGTRIALTSARERRRFEADLLAARAAADDANADSSRARRRLELQADATAALASSTDSMRAVQRLAGVFVPRLAHWCLILIGDSAEPLRWAAAHADPDKQRMVEQIAQLLSEHGASSIMSGRNLSGTPATLLTSIDERDLHTAPGDPEFRDLLNGIGSGSAIVAPSYAHGEHVATLILVREQGQAPFTEEHRHDVAEMSARTGIVIDNTRRYAREHADSVTLQRSLLTAPPAIDGLQIEVRYLPTQDEAQVGGDWYDAYLQADGVPVVAIGDVVGHDIAAAAAMGQLRGVIRTIGYTISGTPSDTLSRADAAARGLGTAVMATAVVARIERAPRSDGPESGQATLHWSNAGHLPPMLLTRSGNVVVLERDADLLIGVDPDRARHDHRVPLDSGDTLVLYTDGLVERSDEAIDVGLARLSSLLAQQHATPLRQLADRVLRELGTARHDDVALLVVRLAGTPPTQEAAKGHGAPEGARDPAFGSSPT
jgi:PAS domain S-box-containing protein